LPVLKGHARQQGESFWDSFRWSGFARYSCTTLMSMQALPETGNSESDGGTDAQGSTSTRCSSGAEDQSATATMIQSGRLWEKESSQAADPPVPFLGLKLWPTDGVGEHAQLEPPSPVLPTNGVSRRTNLCLQSQLTSSFKRVPDLHADNGVCFSNRLCLTDSLAHGWQLTESQLVKLPDAYET
jgi:hypothetical protein